MGYHSFHLLTLQELQVLETIGNLIGQAIENTLLFEEVVKYSSELEKRVEAKTQELLRKNEDLKQAYEDLKVTQERLVKASRLAAIGEMSLTVRHEINNPLTAILGEAQLMLMGQNLSEEMRKNLKTIEQLSIRIQGVVRKLSEVKEDKTKEFMKGLKTIDFE
jgi:C4-dicarboxylate-specific signal transduction histidine kinase